MAVVEARGRKVLKTNWKVSLTVNGENWGVWDVKTGGEVDSSQNDPYKPGGMAPAISMGGSVTTGNVVLSRYCTLEDDWRKIQRLMNAAGKGKAVAKQAALDADGNVYDTNPLTYVGILKRVTPPETDGNSD